MRWLLRALAMLTVSSAATRAQTAPDVVVRTAAGIERRVSVVSAETAAGPREFVRLDALAAALGAQLSVRRDGARFEFAGTAIDVRDGVQYARSGVSELPLIVAPTRDARGLLVPVQFAVDLLPRLVRSYAYDPAARTLRPIRPATRAAPRGTAVAVQPATALPAPTADDPAADAPAVRLPSIPPRTRPGARTSPRDATPTPDVSSVAAAVTSRDPGDATARSRRLVAVDAGHGGPDAGMRGTLADGTPLLEKEVTLGVARALRDALVERGIGVVMTRSTDTLIALGDRGRIANARRADLFVSVHVNAANPGWHDPAAARGFETYFLSDARTEEAREVADRENGSSRYETGSIGTGDPLRFVMSDLAQNSYLRESSRLAAAVQTHLAEVHPGPNRHVHQAGFKVLVTAAMPAVLVEIGFGSNPAEAQYLGSARGRRDLAEAIAAAVSDFLARSGRAASP